MILVPSIFLLYLLLFIQIPLLLLWFAHIMLFLLLRWLVEIRQAYNLINRLSTELSRLNLVGQRGIHVISLILTHWIVKKILTWSTDQSLLCLLKFFLWLQLFSLWLSLIWRFADRFTVDFLNSWGRVWICYFKTSIVKLSSSFKILLWLL